MTTIGSNRTPWFQQSGIRNGRFYLACKHNESYLWLQNAVEDIAIQGVGELKCLHLVAPDDIQRLMWAEVFILGEPLGIPKVTALLRAQNSGHLSRTLVVMTSAVYQKQHPHSLEHRSGINSCNRSCWQQTFLGPESRIGAWAIYSGGARAPPLLRVEGQERAQSWSNCICPAVTYLHYLINIIVILLLSSYWICYKTIGHCTVKKEYDIKCCQNKCNIRCVNLEGNVIWRKLRSNLAEYLSLC